MKNIKSFLILFLFILLSPVPVISANLPNIVEIQKQAAAGNADAQFSLGMAYLFGDHDHTYSGKKLPRDNQQALHWLKLSAAQGNDMAQYNIGLIYRDGSGVAKNPEQARQWFQKSAEQGNNMAQLALGDMYAFGQGIPQDKKQAMDLYRQGRINFELSSDELQFMALQGDIEAQMKLASEYSIGSPDFPRNEQQALYWQRQAATNGSPQAQYMLGMTLAMKDEYDEAIFWLKKAQSQGFEDAGDLIKRIQEERNHH